MKVSTDLAKKAQQNILSLGDAHSQIRAITEAKFRHVMLDFVEGLFFSEVEKLCGKPFSRKTDELCHRGGSDPGSVILQGKRISVKKPRVKLGGEEVELKSYAALQSYDLLCDRVMKHMLAGVSTRNYESLLDEVSGSMGLSKSSVSSAFNQGSMQALEELNTRDLSEHRFCVLMMDGIHFSDKMIIVALGITALGKKIILGLKEGHTENFEICKDLLQSLIERGLAAEENYLFVLDGGKGIRAAVNAVFGKDAAVQRCSLHKLRNIESYLPKQFHPELFLRWKRIHGHVDYATAVNDYNQLLHWLSQKHHEAHNSLLEANMETLTVVRLGVPGLLRKTLHSTNAIESAFSQVSEKSFRVKNWNTGRMQVSRWAAATLLHSEKKFITIKGHKQLPVLIDSLEKLFAKKQGVA